MKIIICTEQKTYCKQKIFLKVTKLISVIVVLITRTLQEKDTIQQRRYMLPKQQ